MEKQIKGEFFITPNYLVKAKATDVEALREYGITSFEGEYLVEIWTRGAGSLDWADYGCDQLLELLFPNFKVLKEKENLTPEEETELDNYLFYKFPTRFPYSFLSRVVEGQEITLHHKNGVEIILTAKQKSSVYEYGMFQNVLRRIKRNTDEYYNKKV